MSVSRRDMQIVWRSIRQIVLDAVFPFFCIGCGKEGSVMCESCCRTLPRQGMVFLSHAPELFGPILALSSYDEKALMTRAIHAYKYQWIEQILQYMGPSIAHALEQHAAIFERIDCIAAVPLHPARFCERGFNQADGIAQHIAASLRVPVVHALRRTRKTLPQTGLSHSERQNNVRNAFERMRDVQDKYVLLVDDVYTTGATMEACAGALKNAGAASVCGFVLAARRFDSD
jgi:competence protein ComFC